jgi:hypothetical protein
MHFGRFRSEPVLHFSHRVGEFAERPSKRKGETRVEFIRRAVEREIERAARAKLRPPKG